MGEFAKKWMAGIAAALVVVAIVAIAIGRMDRKTTTTPSTLNNVVAQQKAAPPTAVAPAPAPEVASTQVASSQSVPASAAKTAEIRNEAVPAASTPQHAAAKLSKPQQHVNLAHPQANAPVASAVANPAPSSQPTTPQMQAIVQSQPQVPQSQPPASPPDVAAPPVQQLAQANTTPQTMQINQTNGAMKTTGKVDINGNFTNDTALVYSNDKIVTPGQNGALVTGTGNSITLGASSQFTAQPNSFLLDGGTSNVNTATGMATKVKEYKITPVDPKSGTQYEVNWQSDGVYVYARNLDVYIDGPCDFHKKLEQGKIARIPDPHRCGVIWLNDRTWPYAVAFGSAVGAGVVVVYYVTRDMSPSSP